MISLLTRRLVLRPWAESDRADFVALCTDQQVMQFIGNGATKTKAEANQRFDSLNQDWEVDGAGLLCIEELDGDRFVGFVGLAEPTFLPEIMPAVEIGWRLLPAAWGNGFATEAATAVLDWALGGKRLDEIVAVIQVDNQRSHRVAEKLGMERQRRTIVPSHRVWADVYGLSAAQWTASQDHQIIETEPLTQTADSPV